MKINLFECSIFNLHDSIHIWLVLRLFVRNMTMNVHRCVRIWKERCGTTLVNLCVFICIQIFYVAVLEQRCVQSLSFYKYYFWFSVLRGEGWS